MKGFHNSIPCSSTSHKST